MRQYQSYVFGDGFDEDRRLRTQAAVLDPLTSDLFARAGLTCGMNVLDVGSGSGNVALLAAQAVGPRGKVLGVDFDSEAVERARRAASDMPNVGYRVEDVNALGHLASQFDAVVGPAILMHLAAPQATLPEMAQCVCPGGLIWHARTRHDLRVDEPPDTLVGTATPLGPGHVCSGRRQRTHGTVTVLDIWFARAAGATAHAGSADRW